MTDWQEMTLGDVITLQRGFDLPVQDRKAGAFPVIASTGEVGRHQEAKVKAPGVVIGRSGSIGGGQYIENDFWPLNTTLWVKDFKGNNERYCYYLLKTIDFQQYNSGSGVPTLNRNHVHPLPVLKPFRDEQDEIADLLGSIDQKIELNQRMNETLEGMARAIFKSWFVDFDPVHAKAEGLAPEGMNAQTAALFPDSFTDEGIPEGWKETKFEKCFDFTMGQSPPGDTYNEEQQGIAFYQGRRDFRFRYPENRVYCTAPSRFANAGDTLLSVRAPVGDLNMAIENCCIGRGLSAIRHKSKGRSFTYSAMLNMQPMFDAYNSEGTVFGSVNKASLGNLAWLEPSKDIVNAFEKIAENLDQKIENNIKQNQTLAALRDTLLPKLISGELRVDTATESLRKAV